MTMMVGVAKMFIYDYYDYCISTTPMDRKNERRGKEEIIKKNQNNTNPNSSVVFIVWRETPSFLLSQLGPTTLETHITYNITPLSNF